jgi:hypothetical protein
MLSEALSSVELLPATQNSTKGPRMKLFNYRPSQLLFTLLSLSLLFALIHTTLVAQTTPKARPALVLVIGHVDPDGPQSNMDPLVLVENGKFRQPFPEESSETVQKKFAERYLATGKKYRVTFGGGEVGTATVASSSMGCNRLHSQVTVEDYKRIPPHLSALATDSAKFGKGPAARRAPTGAERQEVMRMVREIYRVRRTTPALLNAIKTTNLTATDLNGDGEFELIGSFVLETKAPKVSRTEIPQGNARRDLFLIAEPLRLQSSRRPQPQTPTNPAGPADRSGETTGPSAAAVGPATASAGPSFKATLVSFQSYNLPPEGFDSAVDFVDQLDLDGDGVAEVFVQNHGFDAYGYSIYKKIKRGWRQVYTTTGDAC